MRLAYTAILALVFLVSLSDCGGGRTVHSEARREQPVVDIAAQLGELESLSAPAEVDGVLWSQLKTELIRILSASARIVQTATLPDASQTSLSLDSDSLTLSWLYFSQGDYDQN